MPAGTDKASKLRRAKKWLRYYIPRISATFATTCGVGIGLLVVATVMSTPAGLLAFLFSGLVFTYATAGYFQYLKKQAQEKKLKGQGDNTAEDQYLNEVLNSIELTVKPDYQGKTKNLKNYYDSFIFGAIASLASFYFVTQVIIAFTPPLLLMSIVAALMFCTMAYVLSKNFHGGIKNVANNLLFALNPDLESELNPDSEIEHSPNAQARNTFGWKMFKWTVGIVGVISCVAAGIVAGALTQGGVSTAFSGGLGFTIGAAAGPIGWIVFAAMVVSVGAMMAWGINQWLKDHELDKKAMIWYSLFNRPKYLECLQAEFEGINTKIGLKKTQLIEAKKGHLVALQALENFNACHKNTTLTDDLLDESEKLSLAAGLQDKLVGELDALYQEKDKVYHRFQMFQSSAFQIGFAITTLLVTAFCLFGMLIHMARGSQSFAEMLPQVIGVSETIAMTAATGFMWVAMFSEGIFTATSASNAMINEVAVGSQTDQYNNLREKQQTPSKLKWDFFFHTARVMHGMFDGLLALFGSTGAVSKPPEFYAQNDTANQVASAGSATRAATENLVSNEPLKFDYEQATLKPLTYTQLYPSKTPPKRENIRPSSNCLLKV